MADAEPVTMPMQINQVWRRRGRVPVVVATLAYEVYAAVYGPGQSLEHLGKRGGFGAGEVIALLYARQFPRAEWDARVREALSGLVAS